MFSESPGVGVTLKREICSGYGGAFNAAGRGERSVNGGDNIRQVGIECGCGGLMLNSDCIRRRLLCAAGKIGIT